MLAGTHGPAVAVVVAVGPRQAGAAQHEHVRVLTLHRPGALNAVDDELATALGAFAETLAGPDRTAARPSGPGSAAAARR